MKISRQKIVAGNWKMNKTFEEGRDLVMAIRDGLGPTDSLVILCPPFIMLKTAGILLLDVWNMKTGGQNCHNENEGAYTGEVSAKMLKGVGCEFVIIGHSERREYFGETDKILAQKVTTALATGLKAIFCCGERLDAREAGKHQEVVKKQLEEGLFSVIKDKDLPNLVIAYEPVWAIGTGKTAEPVQAQEMQAFIRGLVAKKYGKEAASAIRILYGGSCKPSNAKELFSQEDVDGGLIGGASLNAEDFISIVKAAG